MTLTKAIELVNWHFHDDDGIAADASVKEAWDVIRNYITQILGFVLYADAITQKEND